MNEALGEHTAGSTEAETIKVAIIEDVRTLRDGLSALIDGTAGFQCTGRFRSAEEAIERLRDDLPHVVLADIGLPGMSGIEAVRLLKERFPALTLLMLTVYDDDDRVFEALCAGATGYLLKKTPPARLLESLKEAVQGGAPMSPEIARRVVELFREIRPAERSDQQLTAHELRLLKLLVDGYSYKAAAAALDVSVNTVCFHIKKIYEKLQVHSKSEAVAKALRQRLVK
ncbi:MAG TPA: response regulator transcription factor [Blastocatellia bacterium]|nr:response regulator transcription factor [Blastocatellia bacterium]